MKHICSFAALFSYLIGAYMMLNEDYYWGIFFMLMAIWLEIMSKDHK